AVRVPRAHPPLPHVPTRSAPTPPRFPYTTLFRSMATLLAPDALFCMPMHVPKWPLATQGPMAVLPTPPATEEGPNARAFSDVASAPFPMATAPAPEAQPFTEKARSALASPQAPRERAM